MMHGGQGGSRYYVRKSFAEAGNELETRLLGYPSWKKSAIEPRDSGGIWHTCYQTLAIEW